MHGGQPARHRATRERRRCAAHDGRRPGLPQRRLPGRPRRFRRGLGRRRPRRARALRGWRRRSWAGCWSRCRSCRGSWLPPGRRSWPGSTRPAATTPTATGHRRPGWPPRAALPARPRAPRSAGCGSSPPTPSSPPPSPAATCRHHGPAEIASWTGKLPAGWRDDIDRLLADTASAGASLEDLAVVAQAAYEKWRSQQPDPDDPDDGFDDRYLKLGTTIDGAGRLGGDLTPECAASLQAVLESLGKKAGPTTTAPRPSATTTPSSSPASSCSAPTWSPAGPAPAPTSTPSSPSPTCSASRAPPSCKTPGSRPWPASPATWPARTPKSPRATPPSIPSSPALPTSPSSTR